MAHYRGAHPTSPSAIHCPQLLLREQLWIAVLSENDKKEIVGIGISVEEALRDFDAKYVAQSNPKPPSDPGT
ncbi:MAG: hypothetical protein ABI925_10370 [Verrucomicrobiota bacterium]